MPSPGTNADATPPAVPYDPATAISEARARTTWPHDSTAYTQGLTFDHGRLLESTGLEGHSDLREVVLRTGRVVRHTALPATAFGEGIAALGDRIYQLTWRQGRGYVYNAATLQLLDSVAYTGEGWGLTTDGTALYLSDGSSGIRIITPDGFRERSGIRVSEGGHDVWMLNELELVRGELWANIYQTDLIARIDPSTGRIVGYVDIGHLLSSSERASVERRGGTANGIAFDSTRNVLLVTGKLWPHLFELDLQQLRPSFSPPTGLRTRR